MSRIADTEEIAIHGDASKASVLVVLCGSNDLTAGSTVDACIASYRRLLATINNRFPERPVILLSIPPAGRGLGGQSLESINSGIGKLNNRIAGEAERLGFRFLDLTPLLSKGNVLNPTLTFDGQHLNEAGYATVAGPLYKAIGAACPSLR
jgi:lysophospholipase L1-like esterase